MWGHHPKRAKKINEEKNLRITNTKFFTSSTPAKMPFSTSHVSVFLFKRFFPRSFYDIRKIRFDNNVIAHRGLLRHKIKPKRRKKKRPKRNRNKFLFLRNFKLNLERIWMRIKQTNKQLTIIGQWKVTNVELKKKEETFCRKIQTYTGLKLTFFFLSLFFLW